MFARVRTLWSKVLEIFCIVHAMSKGGTIMAVAHTSHIRIEKHEGPHRTAHIEDFAEPVNFGMHGGIKRFYQEQYGRKVTGPEYPATLDYMIAGIAG